MKTISSMQQTPIRNNPYRREITSSSSSDSTTPESSPETGKPKNKSKQYPNKPAIERQRRARMNEHLSEMKLLIMHELKDQPGRLSKLDKSEILEMTVNHMKTQVASPPTQDSYHLGYSECAWAVQRFLSTCDSIDPEVRIRMINHLAGRMHQSLETNPASQLPSQAFVPHHPIIKIVSPGVAGRQRPENRDACNTEHAPSRDSPPGHQHLMAAVENRIPLIPVSQPQPTSTASAAASPAGMPVGQQTAIKASRLVEQRTHTTPLQNSPRPLPLPHDTQLVYTLPRTAPIVHWQSPGAAIQQKWAAGLAANVVVPTPVTNPFMFHSNIRQSSPVTDSL